MLLTTPIPWDPLSSLWTHAPNPLGENPQNLAFWAEKFADFNLSMENSPHDNQEAAWVETPDLPILALRIGRMPHPGGETGRDLTADLGEMV